MGLFRKRRPSPKAAVAVTADEATALVASPGFEPRTDHIREAANQLMRGVTDVETLLLIRAGAWVLEGAARSPRLNDDYEPDEPDVFPPELQDWRIRMIDREVAMLSVRLAAYTAAAQVCIARAEMGAVGTMADVIGIESHAEREITAVTTSTELITVGRIFTGGLAELADHARDGHADLGAIVALTGSIDASTAAAWDMEARISALPFASDERKYLAVLQRMDD